MAADDALHDRFSETTAAPAGRPGCADSAILAALAAGELDAAARDRWLDHVALCSDCATELRLAREIHGWVEERERSADPRERDLPSPAAAAPTGTASEPLPFRPLPAAHPGPGIERPARRWLPVAASLLLVVLLGWWWVGQETPVPAPVLRGAEAGERMPASGEVLAAAPERLGWTAQAGAEAYRVELSDMSGERLWRSPWVAEPAVELPAELLSRLGDGTYLWTVEARGSVRERLSGPYTFGIEAAP